MNHNRTCSRSSTIFRTEILLNATQWSKTSHSVQLTVLSLKSNYALIEFNLLNAHGCNARDARATTKILIEIMESEKKIKTKNLYPDSITTHKSQRRINRTKHNGDGAFARNKPIKMNRKQLGWASGIRKTKKWCGSTASARNCVTANKINWNAYRFDVHFKRHSYRFVLEILRNAPNTRHTSIHLWIFRSILFISIPRILMVRTAMNANAHRYRVALSIPIECKYYIFYDFVPCLRLR